MTEKMIINSSPFIRSKRKTSGIMADVIISLLPCALAGVVIFGVRALLVLLVSSAAAVGSEALFCKFTKKGRTYGDLSSLVTGLLVGLSLPATIPLWQAALGSVFAILLVKCVFGGIGYNIANPAMCARVFMILSFGEMLTSPAPVWADVTSGATPLARLKDGEGVSLVRVFLGDRGGCIGEVCTLALLMGGAYLVWRGVISWHIPTAFVSTVYLMSLLSSNFDLMRALCWTVSGSVLMGALFYATDYVSSPTTNKGKLLYGAGCGALTCLIRFFGSYPEGVSFAILFMNFTVPFIDIFTRKKVFGGGENEKRR